MGAAVEAAAHGLRAVVFDEQPAPGGQVYRNVEQVTDTRRDTGVLLGADYAAGRRLVDAFRASGADYRPGSAVWQIGACDTGGLEIGISHTGGAELVGARHALVATGAMERPTPLPGWTLPGVMSAGAAQTLLKSAAMVPDVPTVIAGSGPLVYLVAWQLARAGVRLEAVWLTTPRTRLCEALPALPRALLAAGQLAKGAGWLREVKRRGVAVEGGVRELRVDGRERAEAVSAVIRGRRVRREAGLVLLHEGVVPDAGLAMSAGCEHRWDAVQQGWSPRTDARGRTSVDGLLVAGDAAGIGGAEAAVTRGRLAALEAAHRLGHVDASTRDARAAVLRKALARQLRARPFIDRLFRPEAAPASLTSDTVICRCEGVTAAEIEQVIDLGCSGPNQAKAFTRCGMGPCQGRMCGLAVSELFSSTLR